MKSREDVCVLVKVPSSHVERRFRKRGQEEIEGVVNNELLGIVGNLIVQ